MDKGDVPQKVQYERLCGQLCLSSTAAPLLAFRQEVLRALAQLVSGAGVPMQRICSADILISVEIRTQMEGAAMSLSHSMYLLCAASGASGNTLATQTFVAYRRSGGLDVRVEAKFGQRYRLFLRSGIRVRPVRVVSARNGDSFRVCRLCANPHTCIRNAPQASGGDFS